ncbi:MAG: hypothetical protein QG657_966 [Acidobacteriota bacterium]|nr:hypothetical protein [Acidobacteriota bacterium]
MKRYFPQNKRSNFYNIGKDVLINHMMAHIHYRDEGEYLELVKILFYQAFYLDIDDSRARELVLILDKFYFRLGMFILQILSEEKPALLCLSVLKGSLPASLFVFNLTREKYPHIKTVMGGGVFDDQLAIDSVVLEFFIERTPYIDKFIIGEGEILFLKLLRGELPGHQKVYSFDIVTELKNYIYQAETNPYWYYSGGQVSSAEWVGKSYLVFPEKARHLLLLQKRDLDCEPTREERYRRMARFTEHIKKLNLPNPYSLQDIVKADERWMKLHKNAVPPLVEFKDIGKYIDENIRVKRKFPTKSILEDDGAWEF